MQDKVVCLLFSEIAGIMEISFTLIILTLQEQPQPIRMPHLQQAPQRYVQERQ